MTTCSDKKIPDLMDGIQRRTRYNFASLPSGSVASNFVTIVQCVSATIKLIIPGASTKVNVAIRKP